MVEQMGQIYRKDKLIQWLIIKSRQKRPEIWEGRKGRKTYDIVDGIGVFQSAMIGQIRIAETHLTTIRAREGLSLIKSDAFSAIVHFWKETLLR